MPDPIQRNSSVPLSREQLRIDPADTRDVSSSASTAAAAAQKRGESQGADADAASSDFGRSAISVVEKAVKKSAFDAADNVSANSVYLSPDQYRPF